MTRKPADELLVPWWGTAALYVVAVAVLFGEFVFSDEMLYGEDTLALGYMARAFFVERITGGDFPLWAPRLLGGVPTVEAIYGGDAIYPTSLLYFVVEAYRALGWKLVLHVLGGGFFMYGWARSIGLGRAASTVGGLAWLLAPVIVTLVLPGNDGKLMVASLAPLVFWAAEGALAAPGPRTAAGLAGAVALVCLTTQFQSAYFLFLTVGAYAAFRCTREWRGRSGRGGRRALRSGGVFLAAALLGGAIASVQLLPAAQYVTESSRRVATTVDANPEERIAYASSWSYHPEEVAALVVPEFVGNTAADAEWGRGTYWGRNALKLNHEYLGVTVVALALFGLFGRRRRPLRIFMAAASSIWLLYALGPHTPVWRIFYEVVPGISLFRVPAISAFLVSFAVTTLFALGVDDAISEPPSAGAFLREGRGRALVGLVGVVLLGLLLHASGALARLWTTLLYGDADPRALATLAAAAPHIMRGLLVAALLAGLAALIVWALREGKMGSIWATAALAALVAMDLGRIDAAFIRTLDYHAWSAPNANVDYLTRQREGGSPFRVADLRGSDQSVELAAHGIDLLAGHHPNDLARYRQFLGLSGSRATGTNTRHPNVLRMMNVKYVVWPEEAAGRGPYRGAQALVSASGRRGVEAVYSFPGLDRAWLVGRSEVVEDEEAALAALLASDFDPERKAILPSPPSIELADAPAGPPGTVTWELYEPDHRRLSVTTEGPALLIVSENWFPGWVAEIDGTAAEVRRANLTLQAVEIPESGTHTVTLRFTAPTVARALRITLAAALTVVVLAIWPWLGRLVARARSRPTPVP